MLINFSPSLNTISGLQNEIENETLAAQKIQRFNISHEGCIFYSDFAWKKKKRTIEIIYLIVMFLKF